MATARRRPRRSIGFRLLLPIAVATIGVGVLGGVQTSSALDAAREAESSGSVAQALTATVKLNHQLEQELSETEALLQRGGKAGELLLTAQRRRTDEAVARYRATVPVATQVAPEIRGLVEQADAALAELPRLRELAQFPPEGQPAVKTSPEAVYDELTHSMFAVGEALAAAPADARLSALTETVAALNAMEHHSAEQRGLLRTVFARGRFEHGELAELGELHGAETERVAQFERVAGPQLVARYREVVRGADVDKARALLEERSPPTARLWACASTPTPGSSPSPTPCAGSTCSNCRSSTRWRPRPPASTPRRSRTRWPAVARPPWSSWSRWVWRCCCPYAPAAACAG
ncbi:nitrate- and nitrite sensing domain-containing protein [Catellatospora coxensis]